MRRRHPDVDDRDVRSFRAYRGRELLRVPRLAGNLEAGLGEQAERAPRAGARSRRPRLLAWDLGLMAVPFPSGLSSPNRPPSASTRSAARSPDPRPASAPPRPSSEIAITARPPWSDRDLGTARAGMLGDVGERLGDDVVGCRLDRSRQSLGQPDVDLDRQVHPEHELVDRLPEAALGQDPGVDSLAELSQLLERARQPISCLRDQAPRAPASVATLASARPRVMAIETSRCWVPS